MALIYIDRLIQRNNFLLTDLNVHRVVITAILLAAKFFDDAYYNNAYYAKIGGVLVSEMNGLEVDFLFRINFSLHVAPEDYKKYQAELWVHAPPPATPQTVTTSIPGPILQAPPVYSPAVPLATSTGGVDCVIHPQRTTAQDPMMETEYFTDYRPPRVATTARCLPGSWEIYMSQLPPPPAAPRLM